MYSKDYELARKRVKKKKGFYTHLAIYVIVNAFILIMNFLEHPFRLELGPLIPWGVGLAIHYLSVFGFPGSGILSKEWEEREIQRELDRMGSDQPSLKSGEEPSREKLDLRQIRKEWNDRDLV